ncbi:Acetyltransferase (GNAT) family protein [Halogranum gelatinilyticum]|uniref:Acetyltransferase (GNAT) family protein n=1 Tax=Halogranum gelatinilyticum TaxID=660521 RepID=A0A1G9TID3_9EURY|nr:GNAT family N-acetyltransferase [Halogranum gelatinilyticum]SDM47481.1 Acetyltransferase (GNAT) family protein [Halogranum gelatinilyticum]
MAEEPATEEYEIRQATLDDEEAVVDLTSRIWTDRGGDYIPRIFDRWIAGDGERQRTFVVDVVGSDDIAALLQCVLLSEHEAWAQGMRVHPDYRGQGLSTRINDAAFRWARERGATVGRNMVFSWNVGGLGGSRAAGFDPCTEFRWAQPTPDADAEPVLDIVGSDGDETAGSYATDAAWAFWTASDTRVDLKGLALDGDESWAVSELTREKLRRAADEDRLFVVRDDGTRGFTYRNRTYERPTDDGEEETWAEYAVGAWADLDACKSLFAAVARDAASVGAEKTRVLIPESARWVSDVAASRVGVSDEPDFVMAADLTKDRFA